MSDMFNGVEAGSIVRVKFKDITEVTKAQRVAGAVQYLNNYDIGDNINCIILGGDYIVVDVDNAQSSQPFIEIDNHHDGGTFSIYSELIESLDIVDVANKFISERHGVCMVQVDDKLYINGELLENDDDMWSDHHEQNQLTKFATFMEQYILAKALEDSLDDDA